MALPEAFIQVSPDSTGKQVRNVTAQVLEPATGAVSTVYLQVVSLTDDNGNIINLDTSSRLDEMTRLLTALVRGMEILTETQLMSDAEPDNEDRVGEAS